VTSTAHRLFSQRRAVGAACDGSTLMPRIGPVDELLDEWFEQITKQLSGRYAPDDHRHSVV